jgi:hypothetical protein
MAQDTADYFNPGFIRYENYIYNKDIKTVILERENEPLSDACIALNGNQQLQLRFDDLSGETPNYYYRFIQCDFNWQPSSLNETDYTDGFFYEQVSTWFPSFNTYQHYYHYNITFPDDQMRLTKSGNYIILVYTTDAEKPVLTWRFRVFESQSGINSTVRRATIVEDRNSKHEIDFSVNYSDFSIANPFDLKIALQQNGRWDNMITGLKPLFLKEHEVEYNYEEGNVFNGGNEFRTFDIRTLISTTPFVQSISIDSATSKYNVIVRTDEPRSYQRYSIIDDINGKFLIKIYDGRNDNTESDYCNVYFSLSYKEPLANGNFYIIGALTNWMILPAAKLHFNYQKHQYEGQLFLKQGYYNYQYVWVEDGKNIADETLIEGNHFETENDYSIFVYYRDITSRYDRIIGYKKTTSRNIY